MHGLGTGFDIQETIASSPVARLQMFNKCKTFLYFPRITGTCGLSFRSNRARRYAYLSILQPWKLSLSFGVTVLTTDDDVCLLTYAKFEDKSPEVI